MVFKHGGRINEHVAMIETLNIDEIEVISEVLTNAFNNGNKIVIFGNGGSASDAQHLVAEFSGKYLKDRAPLPAISLSSNISAVTAIANDYGYETVFERQLKSLTDKGDCVVGISTSGNSLNVLRAIEQAKKMEAVTISFSGAKGKLKNIVDHSLIVPSESTPRIQEGYMVAGHIICGIVERNIYG